MAKLNLETLELRRLKNDLIFYYKIMHSLTPLLPDDYFNRSAHIGTTRFGSKPQLVKSICLNRNLENDFFDRQITCWNNLPDSAKNAVSIDDFRRQISSVDFAILL